MGVLSRSGQVVDLPIPAGPAVLGVVGPLLAALDGSGPPVRPLPAAATAAALPPADRPDGLALVVRTSGSTGLPRHVTLSGDAVRYAVDAGRTALGGAGRWLLALPADRVGGLVVLLRAALAGDDAVTMDTTLPFTVERFVTAADEVGPQGKVSLVPTQVRRLLDSPAGTEALRGFHTVLVGGAAVPGHLADRARAAGVRLVRSYGMTETCGGCVYDGRPLPGVSVEQAAGDRLRITGPLVADGYWGEPAGDVFGGEAGQRSFLTSDVGTVRDGRVSVQGRADDMVISGGVNIAPVAVEAALERVVGVAAVGVTGVPDVEWGAAVTAVVVAEGAAPDLIALRQAARAVSDAAAPRRLVLVDALPLLESGKLDRRRLAQLAAEATPAATVDPARDPR